MTLSPERYIEAIATESRAFAGAARRDLDATVPSCPEWSVRDLVEHLGEVQRFWTEIASRGITDPAELGDWDETREKPPQGTDVVEWFEGGARALIDLLAVLDLERRIWTWSRERTAAFVPRRMAHEASVHRWDAENAVGVAAPVEPDVAADGIDELLHVYLLAVAPLEQPPGSSVHVHTTDIEGEWLVRLDEEPVLGCEHAKGDAALRGPASDVLLALWGRLPPEAVETHGDTKVLADLRGFLRLE